MARYICAWCGRDLGPAYSDEDSHGICPKCDANLRGEVYEERRERVGCATAVTWLVLLAFTLAGLALVAGLLWLALGAVR